MKFGTKTAVTAVALASSLALATAAAGPAAADPDDGPTTLNIVFAADTTTVLAKTGQAVVFPRTDLTMIDVDLAEEGVNGSLALPQASADLTLGPFSLAELKISIVDPSPVSGVLVSGGTEEAPALDIDVQQSFRIRIDSVRPLGLDTGSAGSSSGNLIPAGGNCMTAPTTANLTGSLDWTELIQNNAADTHVTGSYTIPQFLNCGAFTPVLNAIIAGPNNTLDVHLTGS